MFKKMALLAVLILSPLSYAANLAISVEVPRLTVAEYHAPYAAIWIEKMDEDDKKFTRTLAVWYENKKPNQEGQKWLKDLRQWWRRDGRDLTMPIDGVAGATKLGGTHELTFVVGQAPLGDLPKGQYQLMVEMAREVGGREIVKLPFAWPVANTAKLAAQGSAEVGAVTLVLNP